MNKLISISLQTMLRGLILGGTLAGLYVIAILCVFLTMLHWTPLFPISDVTIAFIFTSVYVGIRWGTLSGLIIGFATAVFKPKTETKALILGLTIGIGYISCITLYIGYMSGVREFDRLILSFDLGTLLIFMFSPLPIYWLACASLGKYAYRSINIKNLPTQTHHA